MRVGVPTGARDGVELGNEVGKREGTLLGLAECRMAHRYTFKNRVVIRGEDLVKSE